MRHQLKQAQVGRDSPNVDHTLKFYNSIKLSQNVYKKQYYPKTHYVSVQMAEPILSLCCMQNDVCSENLQRFYFMSIFMFETSVSSSGPVAFQFLDVSV